MADSVLHSHHAGCWTLLAAAAEAVASRDVLDPSGALAHLSGAGRELAIFY